MLCQFISLIIFFYLTLINILLLARPNWSYFYLFETKSKHKDLKPEVRQARNWTMTKMRPPRQMTQGKLEITQIVYILRPAKVYNFLFYPHFDALPRLPKLEPLKQIYPILTPLSFDCHETLVTCQG